VERGVRRIWGSLGVGDDTELHLDPVGHRVLVASLLGSGGDYRTTTGDAPGQLGVTPRLSAAAP